jgi:hypothetical protein
MTSVVSPEQQDMTYSQVDSSVITATTVVTPLPASKRLVVVWAFIVITGSILVCLFLMNTVCCSP